MNEKPIPGQTDIFAMLAPKPKPLDRVGLAVDRVRECFAEADRLGQRRHAWYARMDWRDVEVLLQHAEGLRAG